VIQELEVARDNAFALQHLREEDALIIQGLVKHLQISDTLCRALEEYTQGNNNEVELMKALSEWRDSLARL
jgi:hypothetical protein